MNKETFWSIIDQARSLANGWERMYEPLVQALSSLKPAEILQWQQIFSLYQQLSYKNKLWAAAYTINGGCSDDGFDYFRGWLTAQGKDVFLNALNNPDSLAEVEACEGDVSFERILGAACNAYLHQLGLPPDYELFYAALDNHPLADGTVEAITSEITYADDIDQDWDEDDEEAMHKWLPKLCEAFDW
ncbi:DUF4240 domain-containing protein [Paenibacillus sp. MMS20-IR301]|uniref:DUF4240 domain-containing protein n=1 Tax=Paenibacillus sp. MMS20-IR301 TaxID=2895946 RepID=UPI0028EFFED2|nr:DUF4240 domain-containing protein [Paenibacillus sp. MMS20-IR301]WNS45180.1 DUF4240 domain-containing protein [Paenibacillus sp. MMS20-IR301]